MIKQVFICLIIFSFVYVSVANEEKKEPTRPVISPTFTARVRGTLFNSSLTNGPSWHGGGLFAYHEGKGFKRFVMNLKQKKATSSEPSIYVHTLDRYDLQYSFQIQYNSSCIKRDIKDHIINPFAWLEHASFSGESSYNGHSLHVWEYIDEKNEYYKLAVKQGTNIPVVIVLGKDLLSMEGMKLEMIVLEWHNTVRPRLLSYVPIKCGPSVDHLLGYNFQRMAIILKNQNWNCADPNCDQTVPEGSGQPDYGCAEFAARSLAAGGYFPGLQPLDDQSNYINYNYNGNTYDLIYTTTLSSALSALGFTSEAAEAGSVNAGCAAFGDGGDGDWSHAIIGVGPGTDDAHNNARYHYPVSNSLYAGVDAVQCPPGVSPGTSSGSSNSGTYYSYKGEKELEQGGRGAIYDEDTKEFKIKSIDKIEEVRMVEEKVNKKF